MRLGEAPDRRGAARRGCPWRLLDLLVQQGAQQLPARARRLHDPRHQPRPQRGGPTIGPCTGRPPTRPPVARQVHRGPGTEMGEERLVLFCSWRPVAAGGVKQQSETDYSFYDTHLEPKLRLSERAKRSEKRRGGDVEEGRSRQRRRQI